MTSAVTAALVSGVVAAFVSLIGAVITARVSFLVAKKTVTGQAEAMRQAQLTEIVRKRIETYPAFYEIIAKYGRNWEINGESHNQEWAEKFLKELIDNNAKNGVFFSERVYRWYGALRNELQKLMKDLGNGREATEDEMQRIYDIIRGPEMPGDQWPGLGTFLKNELGSYISAAISRDTEHPEDIRKLLDDPDMLINVAQRIRKEGQPKK
jgi:hypothetical protein